MRRLCWIVLCFSACTDADPDMSTDRQAACEEAKSHSDLAWIETQVFTQTCSLPSCHRGAAANAGRLDLTPGRSRAELVDIASSSSTTWKRVVPGDPARSYLLVAIGHVSGPRPIDGVMPLGGPMLCVEMREAIERWIQAGAAP